MFLKDEVPIILPQLKKKKKVPDTQGWLSVVLCKEQHLCKR